MIFTMMTYGTTLMMFFYSKTAFSYKGSTRERFYGNNSRP